MVDRLDELQRLHDACEAARSGCDMVTYLRAKNSLTNAAEEALPALLRVARAADAVSKKPSQNWPEMLAALAEPRGTDG